MRINDFTMETTSYCSSPVFTIILYLQLLDPFIILMSVTSSLFVFNPTSAVVSSRNQMKHKLLASILLPFFTLPRWSLLTTKNPDYENVILSPDLSRKDH
jgi:hypothetical protein